MSHRILLVCLLALTGCRTSSPEPDACVEPDPCGPRYDVRRNRGDTYEDERNYRDGKVFGKALELGGSDSGIGVNATLWRAALDTVSFMPLSSVDPAGGVIITEWYSPINEPSERFKVDIIILGRALRPDALRVSLHKQRLNAQGVWRSLEPSEDSVRELEDSILSRARELRQGRGGF